MNIIPSTKLFRIDTAILSLEIRSSVLHICPISSSYLASETIAHRFSIGFRSGELPGHSPFFQNLGKLNII